MLFIFDLDFTLWNCGGTWCDHTFPPYKKLNNNTVVDSQGLHIKLYEDTLAILEELKKQNIEMGLASRTGAPDWARQLLHLFEIENYFKHKEIYPNSKVVHFGSIQKKTGIPFNEMFFFDDETRNIEDVESLGVNCYFVENGINMQIIRAALKKFDQLKVL
jgi:magnesium-dependent phosphatase 1